MYVKFKIFTLITIVFKSQNYFSDGKKNLYITFYRNAEE